VAVLVTLASVTSIMNRWGHPAPSLMTLGLACMAGALAICFTTRAPRYVTIFLIVLITVKALATVYAIEHHAQPQRSSSPAQVSIG
jgi:hypothetical protein